MEWSGSYVNRYGEEYTLIGNHWVQTAQYDEYGHLVWRLPSEYNEHEENKNEGQKAY